MRATLLAERLDAALGAAPTTSAAEVFRRVLAADPDHPFSKAFLIDRTGRKVVAASSDGSAASLADFLGGDDLARIDPAGVVRLAADMDGDRFAAVRGAAGDRGPGSLSPRPSSFISWPGAGRPR